MARAGGGLDRVILKQSGGAVKGDACAAEAAVGAAFEALWQHVFTLYTVCLLYTSPSPRDYAASRMPSSA